MNSYTFHHKTHPIPTPKTHPYAQRAGAAVPADPSRVISAFAGGFRRRRASAPGATAGTGTDCTIYTIALMKVTSLTCSALTRRRLSLIFYMCMSPADYLGPLGFRLRTSLRVGARIDLSIFRFGPTCTKPKSTGTRKSGFFGNPFRNALWAHSEYFAHKARCSSCLPHK